MLLSRKEQIGDIYRKEPILKNVEKVLQFTCAIFNKLDITNKYLGGETIEKSMEN